VNVVTRDDPHRQWALYEGVAKTGLRVHALSPVWNARSWQPAFFRAEADFFFNNFSVIAWFFGDFIDFEDLMMTEDHPPKRSKLSG
jgi:hypothetical protein